MEKIVIRTRMLICLVSNTYAEVYDYVDGQLRFMYIGFPATRKGYVIKGDYRLFKFIPNYTG